MVSEIALQRIQLKYKNETELLEDSLAVSGMPSFPSKVVSSKEEFVDSEDVANSCPTSRPLVVPKLHFAGTKQAMASAASMRQEVRRQNGWLHKLDPEEPLLLFTKPLDSEKLAAVGIVPPTDSVSSSFLRGRMGRGGRIVFDRCNPLVQTPSDCGEISYVPPKPRQTAYP